MDIFPRDPKSSDGWSGCEIDKIEVFSDGVPGTRRELTRLNNNGKDSVEYLNATARAEGMAQSNMRFN